MRNRVNVYFSPSMVQQLEELATRKRVSRSSIVEAAVASFLSPDGFERQEAALIRRLDRITRQVQRLERDIGLTAETLALFVRFWLTITPSLDSEAESSAKILGTKRYEGFVEALGRRLQQGQRFLDDIPEDVGGTGGKTPTA